LRNSILLFSFIINKNFSSDFSSSELFYKQEKGGTLMKTFILLTKLSPDTSRQIKDRAKLGRNWLEQVKEKCPEVKFIAHYALLGEFDFLDIYEAPDEETAAKVSMISLANGAFQAQSLIAIPYKRFLELADEISKQGIIV
jgi:uncharacterized protein with GYD domain